MSRPVVQDPLEALRGAIVRPAATPQDTFIQPVMQPGGRGGSSSGLAAGLAGLSKGLSAYAKYQEAADLKAQEAKAKEDLAAGEMAFHRSQARLQDAVRDGTIRPGMSPMFKDGYLTAMLEEQGYQYQTALEQAYIENPGQFDDPAAFAAWENQVFNSYGESQWANSEATDRQIIENFMPIRKKVRNAFRNKVLNRKAEELEGQRFSLFEQQTTRAYAAFQAGQLSTEEAGALISRLGEQLYQSAPSKEMGKEINKVLLNQLRHVAITQMDPKVLSLARHVKTGTGTLAGTAGFRDSVESTRKEIERKLKARNAALGSGPTSLAQQLDIEAAKDMAPFTGDPENGVAPYVMTKEEGLKRVKDLTTRLGIKPKAARKLVAKQMYAGKKAWKALSRPGGTFDNVAAIRDQRPPTSQEEVNKAWPFFKVRHKDESAQEYATRIARGETGLIRNGYVPEESFNNASNNILSTDPAAFTKGFDTYLNAVRVNPALSVKKGTMDRKLFDAVKAMEIAQQFDLVTYKNNNDERQKLFQSVFLGAEKDEDSAAINAAIKKHASGLSRNQYAVYANLVKLRLRQGGSFDLDTIAEDSADKVKSKLVTIGNTEQAVYDLPSNAFAPNAEEGIEEAMNYIRTENGLPAGTKLQAVAAPGRNGWMIITEGGSVLGSSQPNVVDFNIKQAGKKLLIEQNRAAKEATRRAAQDAANLNNLQKGNVAGKGLGTEARDETNRTPPPENKPTKEVEAARAARRKRLNTLEDKQSSLDLDLDSDLSIDELMEALGEEIT